jgi:hypothetical protein
MPWQMVTKAEKEIRMAPAREDGAITIPVATIGTGTSKTQIAQTPKSSPRDAQSRGQ